MYVYLCTCACICAHNPDVALDTLELELCAVVSHLALGAGNQIAVLASTLYILSNGAISLAFIVTTTLTPRL